MSVLKPDSLRGRTVLLVALCVSLSHLLSLVLYIVFSASTVTLEREEQVADRIATVTRLIEHARPEDRPYLADELSGPRFQVAVSEDRAVEPAPEGDGDASKVASLTLQALGPLQHSVSADYLETQEVVDAAEAPGLPPRDVASRRFSSLFRIHEELQVTIDLPGGQWLNFRISGSAWDHILSPNVIPSVALMTVVTIILTGWALSRPLKPLSRFAAASDELGRSVHDFRPLDEHGPMEVRDAARAFNRMQARIRSLLETRTQMLGAISHDFRTPLTRLRLRIEQLQDKEQRDKAIRDIEDMEAMIAVSLSFARGEGEGEEMETTDLKELIDTALRDMDLPPDKVVFRAKDEPACPCRRGGMRRVLTNIIGNAVTYGDHVDITLFREGPDIIIQIDDDGPGIAEGDREKVFTPFYRLETSRNRETGGVGLGLSIAQNIVQEHGGRIDLGASPKGGLRVRLHLPGPCKASISGTAAKPNAPD